MIDFEGELKKISHELLAACPNRLSDAITYSLLAPGKRIRPRLTFASAKMLELDEKQVLSVALALEMFHCFTLIHDDLPCLDNDDYRRGRKSNHKVFGEAIALLAGDSLLSMSYEVFLRNDWKFTESNFRRALVRFLDCTGPRGVIAGQTVELEADKSTTLQNLLSVHDRKTGALLSAAILIPMDLKGLLPESNSGQILERFSRYLSRAFQIADDLEDCQADQASPSTNILHYLSPSQACQLAIAPLVQSKKDLEESFGKRVDGLVLIADEILEKVRRSTK